METILFEVFIISAPFFGIAAFFSGESDGVKVI